MSSLFPWRCVLAHTATGSLTACNPESSAGINFSLCNNALYLYLVFCPSLVPAAPCGWAFTKHTLPLPSGWMDGVGAPRALSGNACCLEHVEYRSSSVCATDVCLLRVQTTTTSGTQLFMTSFSNPITEKVAHAKEENLSMHQMLDQTLLELNNMWEPP